MTFDRDNCWFLGCKRKPDGRLHGKDTVVECCESHGELGESGGWDHYVPQKDIEK